MLTFDASEFYRATALLRNIQGIVANIDKYDQKPENPVTDLDRNAVRGYLEDARKHFDMLRVRVTAMATDELIYELSAGLTYQRLSHSLDDIDTTLRRELRLTKLLVLERSEENYFDPAEPLFGWLVEISFPSMAYELDEAAKCMALGRYTASVFHLMRLMEVALSALRRCLEIPDPLKDAERNWATVLRKVKEEMDRRNQDAGAGWSNPKDKALFGEVYASLDSVRVAWRNSTMHVENKYTYEEAEHIFGAVKGLARKIAERLDENGEPTASTYLPEQSQLEFPSEDPGTEKLPYITAVDVATHAAATAADAAADAAKQRKLGDLLAAAVVAHEALDRQDAENSNS